MPTLFPTGNAKSETLHLFPPPKYPGGAFSLSSRDICVFRLCSATISWLDIVNNAKPPGSIGEPYGLVLGGRFSLGGGVC
jgi:hypothetical protein